MGLQVSDQNVKLLIDPNVLIGELRETFEMGGMSADQASSLVDEVKRYRSIVVSRPNKSPAASVIWGILLSVADMCFPA